MKHAEAILKLAEQNNGIITASMAAEAGIQRGSLKYLVDKERLVRTERGVYMLPDAWEDELFRLQSRYKRGIFSLETVLFLCDLTDRTPARYHMTFPAAYNLTSPKDEGIRCRGSKEPYYSLGVTELKTPCGNKVRAYNEERTLCDILKSQNRVDIQIVTEAFKRYMIRRTRNVPLLSEYAKVLKVEERLRAYVEILR